MTRNVIVLTACLSVSIGVVSAQRQQPTFRAETQGVSVDVSVRDGNQPVLALRAADFVVYDNNVRQTITGVSIGAVPIDVTLFLGTNNATAARQVESLSGVVKRIAALLRPVDRVRLLTLQNRVVDVSGWRAGGSAEGAPDVQIGGVQSLYDACFLAMMHRPDPDRRHLIVAVTDGVEFGSVVDSTTVRDVARRAEAVLHLVFVDQVSAIPATSSSAAPGGIAQSYENRANPNISGATPSGYAYLRATWFHVMADEQGTARLEEAARLTGGTVRRGTSGETVVETFRRAFDDFRQSYVLRYSAEGVPSGGWHDLRVEMANGQKYTIRARKGYFGG